MTTNKKLHSIARIILLVVFLSGVSAAQQVRATYEPIDPDIFAGYTQPIGIAFLNLTSNPQEPIARTDKKLMRACLRHEGRVERFTVDGWDFLSMQTSFLEVPTVDPLDWKTLEALRVKLAKEFVITGEIQQDTSRFVLRIIRTSDYTEIYRQECRSSENSTALNDAMKVLFEGKRTLYNGEYAEVVSAEITQNPKGKAPEGFVFVEGGTFRMGSNDRSDDEKPIHSVTVGDFYIGKYEVTQAEWQEVMGENPSYFKGANLPVEMVSWYDAIEFCNKKSQKEGLTPAYTINKNRKDPNNTLGWDELKWTVTVNWSANGYRLPTEAEWEYAARGGNKSKGFTYSGSNDIGSVAWYYENSDHKTHQVGTKKANELGIYDMSGNVWEWCWDWYNEKYYNQSSGTDPKGAASGEYRILRGGSWLYDPELCRVAIRFWSSDWLNDDDYDYYGLMGFRLAQCGSYP